MNLNSRLIVSQKRSIASYEKYGIPFIYKSLVFYTLNDSINL